MKCLALSCGERYITAALSHRSGVHMPSLISLATHSGCPLCYEMPRSSHKGEVKPKAKKGLF